MSRFVDVQLPEYRMAQQGQRLAAIRAILNEEDAPDLRSRIGGRTHSITSDVPADKKDAIIHDLYYRAVLRRHQNIPDTAVHTERLLRARLRLHSDSK